MRVRPLVRASVSILMKGDGWNPSTRSTAIPIVILAILTAAVGQDAGRIGGGPPTGRPDAAAASSSDARGIASVSRSSSATSPSGTMPSSTISAR